MYEKKYNNHLAGEISGFVVHHRADVGIWIAVAFEVCEITTNPGASFEIMWSNISPINVILCLIFLHIFCE